MENLSSGGHRPQLNRTDQRGIRALGHGRELGTKQGIKGRQLWLGALGKRTKRIERLQLEPQYFGSKPGGIHTQA